MPTDLERLQVSLEANVKKFENELNRARGVAVKAMKDVETSASGMEKSVLSSFSGIAGGIAAAFSVRQIQQYADTYTQAVNKIKSAGGLGDAAAGVAINDVADIAQRTRSDFASVADLYARLTRTGKDLGRSQGEVSVATEAVAKALKLSGASAAETESTLVQLGQALGSGRLQGDELRSLLENSPVIARAIAKEFGVAVGALKDLGAEGKLTSDRVFGALINAAPEIARAFAGTTATIAESFKALEVAAIRFVGQSGQVSAAGKVIGAVTQGIANNFNLVANGALALGAVIASRLIAAGLTPLVMSIGTAVAATGVGAASVAAMGAAAGGAATGLGIAAVATRVLAGALALLGGIPGTIIFGLVSAVAYFATKSNEGSIAAKAYATALDQIKSSADQANPSLRETAAAVEAANKKMFEAPVKAAQEDLDAIARAATNAKLEITAARDAIAAYNGVNIGAAEKARLVELLNKALADDKDAAIAAAAEIDRLGNVNPNFRSAFEQFAKTLRYLGSIISVAGAARATLAGVVATADANTEQARSRADQDAIFASRVQRVQPTGDTINSDPAIARLRLQRQVVEAEMDETKKKIRDKTKEIYEAQLAAGGGTTLAEAGAAAKSIIAAEDSGGGGGGKGGGGKNTPDKKFAKDILDIQQRTEALRKEQELLGKAPLLAETERAALELRNKAKKDGVDMTPALEASIQREAEAYAKAKVSLDDARKAQEAYYQLQNFIGQNLSSFFSDIVSGGKNAGEALMNLTKRLADAALQAALLGQGPLAALFGTASGTSGPGGLIGALFGGLKGLGGTTAAAALPYGMPMYDSGGYTGAGGKHTPAGIVHRGEYVMDKATVSRLGVANLDRLRGYANGGFVGVPPAGAAGGRMAAAANDNRPPVFNINVVGATGNTEVRQMVAAGVSAGMRQVISGEAERRKQFERRVG